MSLSIITGLIVMFCWGVAGFLLTIPTRKIGTLKTQFTSNLLSLIPTFFVFVFFREQFIISKFNILLLSVGGFFMVFGLYNFYRAIEIGEVSVVSTINGAYSMVAVFLAVLFLGENLTTLQIISIVTIFTGLFLTSTDLKKIKTFRKLKGVKGATLGMILQGVQFFLLGVVGKETLFLGQNSLATNYLTVFFFTGVINPSLFMSLAAIKKQIPKWKDIKQKYFPAIFFITTTMFVIAWLVLNYGLSNGNVSIVMPISSLNPAITVILAMVFYKEKLVLNQKLGILVVLMGLFFISL